MLPDYHVSHDLLYAKIKERDYNKCIYCLWQYCLPALLPPQVLSCYIPKD